MIQQDVHEAKARPGRAIAIVSGKGGSGKTISVAVMAAVLDMAGIPVVLLDADPATAGLTYYLGPKYLKAPGVGLSQLDGADPANPKPVLDLVQEPRGFKQLRFLGMGEHKRLENWEGGGSERLHESLRSLVKILKRESNSWILVDCRGGIDEVSIEICEEVDDIVIVAEPDPTSFQATIHVTEKLRKKGLDGKIKGFFTNKVFEDPETYSVLGAQMFGTRYLYSVPFDSKAALEFYVARIPNAEKSDFGVHIWHVLRACYPNDVPRPPRRAMTHKEFRGLGFWDRESRRGGAFVGIAIVALATWIIYKAVSISGDVSDYPEISSGFTWIRYLAIVTGLFGLFSAFDRIRRGLGRLITFTWRKISPSRVEA